MVHITRTYLTIILVGVAMLIASCIYCLYIKLSDLKLRQYIIEMAKRRGIKVDLDKLEPKHVSQSPLANENCAIFVPDVGIII